MSVLFQKIEEQFKAKLPFVCYCKPNSDKIIALFQKNDHLVELNGTDLGFAFVSFDNLQRYLIPENQSDIYVETVSNEAFVVAKNIHFPINESDKIQYENLVEKGVGAILNNKFEKVVLSRKEIISISNFDIELMFNQLIMNYSTAFNYCFYHPKIGFWSGASPEQFLKIEESKLKTVALAGTQLFDKDSETIWQEKEIEEQQIVTDFIVSNLKEFSKKVSVSKPYTHQAGSIVHIKTDIEAEINIKNVNEIINALHPTPAVCGFPKEVAKSFIIENEGYNREFYAGFLGEWKKDFLSYRENYSDLFVNLRCMKISQSQAELFVGCGINKGSVPEKEYIEMVNKSQIMKKVL